MIPSPLFGILLGIVTALSITAAPGREVSGDKPNLILVLLDDVSAKEFTCYGGKGIATPHLDRMAREGVMFRTAWSTPLCGPSRALLHTGRYGGRTHYLENDIMPRRPFWQDNQVLGKLLQSAGYVTAMIGKSHFSHAPRADLGFDEDCIARFWPGYAGPPQAPAAKGTASMYAVQWYWHPGLVADGKGMVTRPDDFGPDLEVERIRDFIRRRKSETFFVYYPTNLPHMEVRTSATPTSADARWNYTDVPERDAQGRPTGRRVPGTLKSNLEYADFLIGRIWEQVVAEGLDRKTILLVTGDNGTAGYGKGKLTSEVALRVPFLVYGPGRVPALGSSDVLIDFDDILPTLAELAGAKIPASYALDGTSFAPLLRGKPFAGRQWIHSYSGSARWLRDQRWLLDGAGRFYDCGDSRDESTGYRDVTSSTDPAALAARNRFSAILQSIPAPDRDDPQIGPDLERFERRTKSAGQTSSRSQAERPKAVPVRNLVFILADDLGVMDLGCQGSSYYATPNLDAFARTATRFTNAYAAHPVCSPTRASILTGRYPARLHLTTYIPGQQKPAARLAPPDWTPYVQQDELTYAEALRDHGFKTLHVGKWHVSTKTTPGDHGFQTVVRDQQYRGRDPQDPWYVDYYTRAVESFMESNRRERFLVVLSHGTVHVPLYEREERIAPWRTKHAGENGQNNPVMAAMIERMDWSVGRVLAKIRELGIEDETAVVFSSDNGGLSNVQDEQTGRMITATSNLPWRGGKSQLYEGGIRIPLLIRCPGRTTPHSVCAEPVITNDLFPTFLEMTGLSPLPSQHLDGLSLAPLLGGAGSLNRQNLFWHYPHYQTLPPHGAVRSGKWKLVVDYESEKSQLFDLSVDPGEQQDQSEVSPAVAQQLRRYLREHLTAIGGQMPAPNPGYNPTNPNAGTSAAPFSASEGDPRRAQRPVSTNPENGANWPVP